MKALLTASALDITSGLQGYYDIIKDRCTRTFPQRLVGLKGTVVERSIPTLMNDHCKESLLRNETSD